MAMEKPVEEPYEKPDVKGGIVIDQLKRYAKRLSDVTGQSANATIEVWYHPESANDNGGYNVELKAFDYSNRQHVRPQFKSEDLRDLGNVIDSYLRNLNH